MRRFIASLLLAACAAPALAANPVAQPSRLDPAWQAKVRSFLQQAVEIPSVVQIGRAHV